MIQGIDNVFQFAKATKKNEKKSNKMESLTLRVDGPITERAYIRGGGSCNRNFFFCLLIDGPITGRRGLISRDFTAEWLYILQPCSRVKIGMVSSSFYFIFLIPNVIDN